VALLFVGSLSQRPIGRYDVVSFGGSSVIELMPSSCLWMLVALVKID